MDTKFNVVYAGLKDGVTAEEFIAKFCDKFGISEEKAQKIVSSTSDVVIKKDLDEAKAKKYASAFESCGIVARLDEIAEESGGLSLEPMDGEEDAQNTSVEEDKGVAAEVCPKCGSEQIENDECLACGIYISKYLEKQKSASIQYNEESETSVSHSQVVSESDDSTGNPYATPEAPLEKNTVSKEGQGSIEGGINGDYDFTISEIFSEAWERTKGAKGTFLLSWLFYILVAFAVNFIFAFLGPDPEALMNQGRMSEGMMWAIIPSLLTIPILYPVLAGIILLGIHRAVDADISAVSVFSHYNKVIPLTILTIVTGILTMIGFMLLVVPGIYLAVAYMMAMALMIDRDMGVWEALETSRKAVSKHWFKIFFLYLLLGILFMVASIPLFIGLIWVLPLAAILHGVLYKYMFGVESVE